MGLLLVAVRDELVWIDCEMTGLDLKSDRLIEIAALVKYRRSLQPASVVTVTAADLAVVIGTPAAA